LIVFRYLSREVLVTLSAVSAVLLVIIMSGRFIKYMAQAAQGVLDPSVLFLIMGYRMPGFLQLILPLGLFLGILLAYGRLYLDSEMTVLSATGMSNRRLLGYSMAPAAIVAVIVAWLSLGLAPQGVAEVAKIFNQQDAMTEFDTLVPGRFQAMKDGSRVTYTEGLSDDRGQLAGVFISEKRMQRQVEGEKPKQSGITVLVAEKGRQVIQADGRRYLILENGYRYDGNPGQADYRATQYETHGVLLPKPSVSAEIGEREAIPSRELIGSDDPRLQAELQWQRGPDGRWRVDQASARLENADLSGQGRFLMLLPAILLYMAYLALLIGARGQLDKGKIPMELGLWWVHALFLLIGAALFLWQPMKLKLASRRAVKEMAHA